MFFVLVSSVFFSIGYNSKDYALLSFSKQRCKTQKQLKYFPFIYQPKPLQSYI